ncbi:MAG TPA: DUF4440 domain-containing protein [Burkholderiaceae bacterium]|jgi:hypothetical protein|nr:DUF4440 domain-containing protein [Burkholderiaceae bacterium]
MDAALAALTARLADLEARLHHPGLPGSRPALEALLHPGFHEVGRSGQPYDRETVIAYLAGVQAPPDVMADRHRAEWLAPGAALLSYRSADRSADGRLTRHTLRSSVWLLGPSGGWQLFYHQGTPTAAF